jgi:hypothetical protein
MLHCLKRKFVFLFQFIVYLLRQIAFLFRICCILFRCVCRRQRKSVGILSAERNSTAAMLSWLRCSTPLGELLH